MLIGRQTGRQKRHYVGTQCTEEVLRISWVTRVLCVTMSRCVCCEPFSREFVDLMLVIVCLRATCAYYTVCRQQINIKNLLNAGPQHIYIAFVKLYLYITMLLGFCVSFGPFNFFGRFVSLFAAYWSWFLAYEPNNLVNSSWDIITFFKLSFLRLSWSLYLFVTCWLFQ